MAQAKWIKEFTWKGVSKVNGVYIKEYECEIDLDNLFTGSLDSIISDLELIREGWWNNIHLKDIKIESRWGGWDNPSDYYLMGVIEPTEEEIAAFDAALAKESARRKAEREKKKEDDRQAAIKELKHLKNEYPELFENV